MGGLVVLVFVALILAAGGWAAERWPLEWVGRLLAGGSASWGGRRDG